MVKTIFVTAFQAVEVKNILRTGIVKKLLANHDVRVVLLMKNNLRIEHYHAEFSDPNLIYEAIDPGPPKGLEAFFSNLKFTLLRTDTTKLRRHLFFEHKKDHPKYYSAELINWALARPAIRKAARYLDQALVPSDVFSICFEKYKPDLVFLAHLFSDEEAGLLREAKKRGIRTIGLVNSWDKVTARCILRSLPDKLIVFNDVVKKEVMDNNEMKPENIFVSGLPQYDVYFEKNFSSREDFFRRLNMDPKNKLLVYAPAGSAFSDVDWDVIDLLYKMNEDGKFGENVSLLVRFQPNDFISDDELKARPQLVYNYPGVRFAAKRGGDWDMTFADISHLKDTLYHMSILISYGSSLSVDTAIFDKPVIHLNFEPKKAIPYRSPTRFYGMDHNKKVFSTGGVKRAGNESELILWIKKYLEDPSLDRAGRKKLVEQQCGFADGKSAERIADYIMAELG